MDEKKKPNWDKWIGAATGALGRTSPVGAMGVLASKAVNKVKTDARNEARAMSYPKREVTYSRTPQERKAKIERMMSSPTFGNVERPAKSGSVGRPSAEKVRDNRRQYEDWEKKNKK
jgi:hypothetical protein